MHLGPAPLDLPTWLPMDYPFDCSFYREHRLTFQVSNLNEIYSDKDKYSTRRWAIWQIQPMRSQSLQSYLASKLKAMNEPLWICQTQARQARSSKHLDRIHSCIKSSRTKVESKCPSIVCWGFLQTIPEGLEKGSSSSNKAQELLVVFDLHGAWMRQARRLEPRIDALAAISQSN